MVENEEERQLLTEYDIELLNRRLDYLENVVAPELAKELAEAKGFGDLSENAEYDAATEAIDNNDAEIANLRHVIATAKIVTDEEIAKSLDIVRIGHKVTIEDTRGEQSTWVLVGTFLTDSVNHQISNESPAGSAMMGCHVGEMFEVQTPSGRRDSYRVVNIEIPTKE